MVKDSRSPLLLCSFSVMGLSAFGQSPPVDLANMSLGDLLNAKIVRSQSNQPTQAELSNGSEQELDSDWLEASRFHFSMSYINVKFEDYRDGTKKLSNNDVLWTPGDTRTDENFPVVPTTIYQEVILFKAACDLTERYSLNLSIPYIKQETDHISVVPGFSDFIIESEGLGDVEAGVSWLAWFDEKSSLLLSLGLSFPTGSIDEEGRTPRDATQDTQLPYTMQLGSGTYDFKPSLIYTAMAGDWAYGADLNFTIRTGENDRDYRLGNVYQGDIWVRSEHSDWFQPSLRIYGKHWERISGQDDEITVPGPFPYPAAVTNPRLFGGTKFIGMGGLRLRHPKGWMENSFLELEAGLPFYEDLNGPQPSEDWRMSASLVINF